MDVTFYQLAAITGWAFCCGIDQFCGLLQIHRPIVTGLIVGLILGDWSTGLITGSILELMFLGITPANGIKPLNIAVGANLSVIFAILLKMPPEAAAALSVSFAIIAHGFITLIFIVYSSVINKADAWAEKLKLSLLTRINYYGLIVQGIVCALIICLVIALGEEAAKNLNELIPAWILSALVQAGGLLPGIGIALLLSSMFSKRYLSFLLLGFLLTTAFYLPLLILFGFSLCVAIYDFYGRGQAASADKLPLAAVNEYTDSTVRKIITKHDLNIITVRSLLLQASFNFQRMQAGGFLYSLLPALKKIHLNKNDLRKSLHNHLNLFNTSPFLVNFILGFVVALEERKQSRNLIQSAKIALMLPLQSIGDTLYLLGILPLTAAFGASISMNDALDCSGVVSFFIIFNIIHLGLRWLLTYYGYSLAGKCVYINNNKIDRYCRAGQIVGMIMLGALINYLVRFNLSWVITIGSANVALQAKLLDSILPNLLPLIYTLAMLYFCKRKVSLNKLVIGTISFTLLGTAIGIM